MANTKLNVCSVQGVFEFDRMQITVSAHLDNNHIKYEVRLNQDLLDNTISKYVVESFVKTEQYQLFSHKLQNLRNTWKL